MAELTVLMGEQLKIESRKYIELRKEFDRTKQERDKVAKRLTKGTTCARGVRRGSAWG